MCGIAGIVAAPGVRAPLGPLAAEMGRSLSHRGPDGSGVWTSDDGRVALAHTRLSVIDRAGGAQPMGVEGCQVVFNGEIYNHHELRGRLRDKGHSFRSRSDTEVILRGYLEWGAGVVDRLDGMFALALWDGRSRQLWMARDRAGQKPLYYARNAGRFWFASEIKGILAGGANPSFPRRPFLST